MNAQDLDKLGKAENLLCQVHLKLCQITGTDADVRLLTTKVYRLLGLLNGVIEKKTDEAPKA